MTLNELKIGESAIVNAVNGYGAERQHLLDMGLIPGIKVTVVKYAPMGDPIELRLHGYSLSLRKANAEKIEVRPVGEQDVESEFVQSSKDADAAYNDSLHEHNSHPGLGEEGKFHSKTTEKSLPKDTILTFDLVGQQNSGKTTLFNQITGENQHAGNFPGVTAEIVEKSIRNYARTSIKDMPGIYSLSPYTEQERIAYQEILTHRPKCIINVVDASNVERHLYLTMQLMELGIPMVLALNMIDEVKNNGGSVRVNKMEEILGIPVVPISATKNEGIGELMEHAIHVAKYQEVPIMQDFCQKEEAGGAVHRCLHSIMHLIEDHAQRENIPLRFAASKLAEGSKEMQSLLHLDANEKEILEHILVQMEEERGFDRAAAMADMRFSFIKKLCAQTVVKPIESKEHLRSKKIDEYLTGKWTAIPIFMLVMFMVIWLSIDVIGSPLQQLLDQGIKNLADFCQQKMLAQNVNKVVVSLIIDGVFGGVGCILSFVPIIVVLFFFLSMIEDSGYMSRIAFVTDKLLRKVGLSGRSIVPMLIGFGCSVPAIMATRTLPSARDRLKTILLVPFMSCSAKVPIYAFFTSMFFPGYGGLVLICLYLIGILVGILITLITKYIGDKSEAAPFVMELPDYRMPIGKNVVHLLWDKTKDFIQKAFTVIFVASIVIWFLQSFDFQFQMVQNSDESMLARLAGLISPLFRPIGLGDWRIVTALIAGFMRKENVVVTLGVLDVHTVMTVCSSVSMLVFCLLYTPCVAAIAAVKRELGGKWTLFVVLFQCSIAWLVSFVAYFFAGLVF